MFSSNKIIKNVSLDPDVIVVGHRGQLSAEDTEADTVSPGGETEESILRSARSEARKLIDTAVAESEAIRKKAYEQGYQDALSSVKAEMREAMAQISQLASRASLDSEQLLRTNEEQIVDLTLAVARKVVGRELAIDHSFVVNAVKEAIASAEVSTLVRIKVSSEDVETLSNYWQEAYGDKADLSSVEIIADAKVQPGGCVIDTKTGVIDAQIETKFSEIAKTLEVVRTE